MWLIACFWQPHKRKSLNSRKKMKFLTNFNPNYDGFVDAARGRIVAAPLGTAVLTSEQLAKEGLVGIYGLDKDGVNAIAVNDEVIAKLKDLCDFRGSPQVAHFEADRLLCKMLSALGYNDIVEIFNRVGIRRS